MNIKDYMLNRFGGIKRVAEVEGEVGIEIEVEGNALPERLASWFAEEDGSLRGESKEYVLKSPVAREDVSSALSEIKDAYKLCGSVIKESPRQSVHVHINIQDLSLTQVYTFILLFLILEEPLVYFCGENRESNLFCLRAQDAEFLYDILEEASSFQTFSQLNTDDIRYSAINISSIFKYGSLEFRSLRGTDDFDLISKWVDILLAIKDAVVDFKDPTEIIPAFSILSPVGFVKDILGEHSDVIFSHKNWERSLYRNMRLVQSIVYNGDWEGLSAEVEKGKEPEVDLNIEDELRAFFPPPILDLDEEEGDEDEF